MTYPPDPNGPYRQPPYFPNQPPPQHRPPRKRHWVRNAFLALGTFIVVIIAVSAALGGGKNGSTPPAASSSAPPSAASSPAAAAKAATLGTPVRDGKFQFTVTSVTQAKSVGDTANGFGDTAQGEYTILHVSVTNISSAPQTLDDAAQYVYDAAGRKYDVSSSADIDLNSASGSGSVFLNDINPGNTVQGQLAFDMPAGAKAVKAELHDSPFSGGIAVSL